MNFFTSTESEQTAGLYFSNYHETSKHRYPEKSGEKKKKKKLVPIELYIHKAVTVI